MSDFPRLEEAIEKRVVNIIINFRKHIKSSSECAPIFDELLNPKSEYLCYTFPEVQEFEQYQKLDAVDSFFDQKYKEYLEKFPIKYHFITHKLQPFDTSLCISSKDFILIRLALNFPQAWSWDLYKGKKGKDKISWAMDQYILLLDYLKFWDYFCQGTTLLTKKNDSYTIRNIEDAFLQFLSILTANKTAAFWGIQRRPENPTEKKILTAAFKKDPHRKKSAFSLAKELEEDFKIKRKTTVKTLKDGSLLKKDTSFRPSGLKFGNIYDVLRKKYKEYENSEL
ncbi:MAG: hypothetical protein WC959_01115 [Kiritimatiellales bacterium]